MKTYTITRTITWTFEVEADSQEEALDLVMDNIDEYEDKPTTRCDDEWSDDEEED